MGEALRRGGLYQAADGTWHDANGYPANGPTADEKRVIEERERALWEQEQQLLSMGVQRVVMQPAAERPAAPPAARAWTDTPPGGPLGIPTYAPAPEPDAGLSLTEEELAQIEAVKQAARERLAAEQEASAKALAERREQARQEAAPPQPKPAPRTAARATVKPADPNEGDK